MKKRETYNGSWMDYQKDLQKLIVEDVIHNNWTYFIWCFEHGMMPEKAVEKL